jgi:HEAT repeat protein
MAHVMKTFLGLSAVIAAMSGLAAQPDTLFQEGVKALRLGKKEEALAKFQAVLAADPTHEQAFTIWQQTDRDIWNWLLLEQGEMSKIAAHLADLAKLNRKTMSRDEAAIAPLVETATAVDKDYGERYKAINKLVADHGEFAVPALVKKLAHEDDRVQDRAILALHRLGSAATLPLIEALNSEEVLIRRNVAAALSHIGDTRALPAVSGLANNDGAEEVRFVARKAVDRLGGAKGDAVEAFLRQVDAYLAGAQGEVSDVVWTWKDGGLVAEDVPPQIYRLAVAQKFAHSAWRLDPVNERAKSAYVRALLAEAAAIDEAVAGTAVDEKMAALKDRPASLRVKALVAGPEVLRRALGEARDAGMVPVAVETAKLLGQVENRSTLPSSPLLAALDDGDKRIAYAAALAIAEASGGTNVPGVDRVVKVLGEAVGEESLRTIFVVDGARTARTAAEASYAGKRGTAVQVRESGASAAASLLTFPNVDVIVVNEILPDVVPEHLIGLVRKDDRLKDTKILVVANDPDQAAQRFGDRINGAIKGPLSAENLEAKVSEVLAGVDMGSRRQWADNIAAAASEALAELAQGDVQLGPVATDLAAQLSRPDAVSIPAAKALGAAGGPAEVNALAAAITGSGSSALKAAAAKALGCIAQHLGSLPAPVVDQLVAALPAADADVRAAIAGALGRAHLPPGDSLRVLETVNGLAGLGAPVAEAPVGGQ